MGERNPLLKYLQAAGLQAIELFETDEVKIINIVDDEFIDISDEAEEYFVKDSAIILMLVTGPDTNSILIVTNFVTGSCHENPCSLAILSCVSKTYFKKFLTGKRVYDAGKSMRKLWTQ